MLSNAMETVHFEDGNKKSLKDRLNQYLTSPRTIEKISESCALTTLRNGIVGFGFGGLIGLFLSGIPSSIEPLENIPIKGQVKVALREMGSKTWSSAKNFGIVSVLFSAFECTIEKYRAKTDIYNTMSAGCLSGAVLARGTGPKGMLIGCAGFATFSSAMEYFLSERE